MFSIIFQINSTHGKVKQLMAQLGIAKSNCASLPPWRMMLSDITITNLNLLKKLWWSFRPFFYLLHIHSSLYASLNLPISLLNNLFLCSFIKFVLRWQKLHLPLTCFTSCLFLAKSNTGFSREKMCKTSFFYIYLLRHTRCYKANRLVQFCL